MVHPPPNALLGNAEGAAGLEVTIVVYPLLTVAHPLLTVVYLLPTAVYPLLTVVYPLPADAQAGDELTPQMLDELSRLMVRRR